MTNCTVQFSYVLSAHEIGKWIGLTLLRVPRLTERLQYNREPALQAILSHELLEVGNR